jgi:hypothetical protein
MAVVRINLFPQLNPKRWKGPIDVLQVFLNGQRIIDRSRTYYPAVGNRKIVAKFETASSTISVKKATISSKLAPIG